MSGSLRFPDPVRAANNNETDTRAAYTPADIPQTPQDYPQDYRPTYADNGQSPLQDPDIKQHYSAATPVLYQQAYSPVFNSNTLGNHPPTPPHLDQDIRLPLGWNAETNTHAVGTQGVSPHAAYSNVHGTVPQQSSYAQYDTSSAHGLPTSPSRWYNYRGPNTQLALQTPYHGVGLHQQLPYGHARLDTGGGINNPSHGYNYSHGVDPYSNNSYDRAPRTLPPYLPQHGRPNALNTGFPGALPPVGIWSTALPQQHSNIIQEIPPSLQPGEDLQRFNHYQNTFEQAGGTANSRQQSQPRTKKKKSSRKKRPHSPVLDDLVAPMPAPTLGPEPPNWDAYLQDIVTEYEGYKSPIKLYTLSQDMSTSYTHAQSWLGDLFDKYVKSPRWFTHTSNGFIKSGTNHTFVVLHNATDPFMRGWRSESSTTIGVYGASWYEHSEIHWTTYAPDIRSILDTCINQGLITEVCRWNVDDKPSEKRFHRAYWLAANREPLGGLLNHGPTSEAPNDPPDDDPDPDFEVTEEDLTNEWDVSEEFSAKKWNEIVEETERTGIWSGEGIEHVITGGSEQEDDDT